MTTLSTPDLNDLSAIRLPRDEGGPVFAEPWEAQAFALAVKLSEQGHFTWKDWAATLADELKAASDRGEPDDGSRYYHHWLAALERLVTGKGLTDAEALYERKEAWAEAYLHTPHGKPVELPDRRSDLSPFERSPVRQFTRADGASKCIRIQDGHLFVCKGCCCGRTDKGFPELPLEEFKTQWKRRGIRRRFHLTVSGCLGPCALANVVLIQFHGQLVWLHSINSPDDVTAIYTYAEQMLLAGKYLDPPHALSGRRFQRYGFESAPESPSSVHL
jgi:nitrile hydratase accessory protein